MAFFRHPQYDTQHTCVVPVHHKYIVDPNGHNSTRPFLEVWARVTRTMLKPATNIVSKNRTYIYECIRSRVVTATLWEIDEHTWYIIDPGWNSSTWMNSCHESYSRYTYMTKESPTKENVGKYEYLLIVACTVIYNLLLERKIRQGDLIVAASGVRSKKKTTIK